MKCQVMKNGFQLLWIIWINHNDLTGILFLQNVMFNSSFHYDAVSHILSVVVFPGSHTTSLREKKYGRLSVELYYISRSPCSKRDQICMPYPREDMCLLKNLGIWKEFAIHHRVSVNLYCYMRNVISN